LEADTHSKCTIFTQRCPVFGWLRGGVRRKVMEVTSQVTSKSPLARAQNGLHAEKCRDGLEVTQHVTWGRQLPSSELG
jgi:hypothetical protein